MIREINGATIRRTVKKLVFMACLLFVTCNLEVQAQESNRAKELIHALYIPLADHYAALVAYQRYRNQMVHADFRIRQMKSWDFLRAYFHSGEVDMAFVMSPLAMNMYREKPDFRWIGLMHRDGNALAITVPPPKSPAYLRGKNTLAQLVAFEQSLPWEDIVETG